MDNPRLSWRERVTTIDIEGSHLVTNLQSSPERRTSVGGRLQRTHYRLKSPTSAPLDSSPIRTRVDHQYRYRSLFSTRFFYTRSRILQTLCLHTLWVKLSVCPCDSESFQFVAFSFVTRIYIHSVLWRETL